MVLLASGALLVAPGLLRDMDLRIAVLLTALSAAAFIASLITNRRLVQSHAISDPDGVRLPTFDGMAELWFDDIAGLRAARQSPQWRASSEDEANFIDGARTALFLTEEREIQIE